jgi:mercuric reductase
MMKRNEQDARADGSAITGDGTGELRVDLSVQGMTCDACAAHVEAALQSVEGGCAAQVPGWRSGRAVVTFASPGGVAHETLIRAVNEAGYKAEAPSRPPSDPAARETLVRISGDWPNQPNYDLVVIGTGGGGMAAAIKAAEMGHSVCIIEKGTLGGTCVNIGCVPSKTLIRAAEAYHKAGHQPFRGVHTKAEGLDWAAVIAHKDELVARLRQAKYADVLSSYRDRITVMQSRARFLPGGVVALDDGRTCSAHRVVLATGARPSIPAVPGIDGVGVLTSTSAMELREQPRSLIVVGGRFIALELGQTFARFGTKVTILQRSARLLPEHEPEIADGLGRYLREEGVEIHTGVRLLRVREERDEKVVTVQIEGRESEFRAEHILVATGRTPNTEDLGLEMAGVQLDPQGFILVDDHLQTTNPRIYAAGDVTNRPKLVYVAAAAGGIAAENALGGNHKKLDLSVVPHVIFTDPQAASVGLTEAQAAALGYSVETSALSLDHVPRALAARDTRGLIKLVAETGSGRLLGVHVLAAEGGEIIQTAALAVKFGMEQAFTYHDLANTLFPYLTQAEGIKLAALAFRKDVGKLSCCAG